MVYPIVVVVRRGTEKSRDSATVQHACTVQTAVGEGSFEADPTLCGWGAALALALALLRLAIGAICMTRAASDGVEFRDGAEETYCDKGLRTTTTPCSPAPASITMSSVP